MCYCGGLLPFLGEVISLWTFLPIRMVNDIGHEWLSATNYFEGDFLVDEIC